MNKINVDFERIKNDYKWNLIILIYQAIFIFIPLICFLIKRCSPSNNTVFYNIKDNNNMCLLLNDDIDELAHDEK